MPALLDLEPTVTVALGRALPGFRRTAAERIVREAAGLAAAAGAEPVPFVDIPLVLAAQIRMVLRVAAIYGETLDAERAKEIIGAVMGGMLVRTAARQVARLVPVVGWAAAGGVAAAGTYALGRATIEYFASGKTLGQRQLRDLYHRMLSAATAIRPRPRQGAGPAPATRSLPLDAPPASGRPRRRAAAGRPTRPTSPTPRHRPTHRPTTPTSRRQRKYPPSHVGRSAAGACAPFTAACAASYPRPTSPIPPNGPGSPPPSFPRQLPPSPPGSTG